MSRIRKLTSQFLRIFISCLVLQVGSSTSETITVRHIEGITLGFLTLHDLQGELLAYGEMKQVWKSESSPVVDDLQFHFKDGSFYEETTKFTQRGKFRLISDQVIEKGPAFKHDRESWIDAATGTITIKTAGEKQVTDHLNLPADVSNGLLFTLTKNIDPSIGASVSMVAISSKPRLVRLDIRPGEEKTFRVGAMKYKAQHYLVKIKIPGTAGRIAPLLGKEPPTINLWVAKNDAPTFLEFEGPLYEDGPVWRIQLAAPEPYSQ